MPELEQDMHAPRIDRMDVSAYEIPTESPEADGTQEWRSTTLVLVELTAGGSHGIGFTYGHAGCLEVIRRTLAPCVLDADAMDTPRLWQGLVSSVRNAGRPGVAALAIAAVDIAAWDLKARLLHLPLCTLLGKARDSVPAYGSGGFTSYDEDTLARQLADWAAEGFRSVKMKVGKHRGTRFEEDVRRIHRAREAIGPDVELFIDANGAYEVKQALALAARTTGDRVAYFEEPVPADHPAELAFLRHHLPMDLAAGEYGYDPWYFRSLLQAGAVDILQADVTRCLGITGWLQAADLAFAFNIPFSAHTAPALHAAIACAVPAIAHIEYFYDHVRIERMLFDGCPRPAGGALAPDLSRQGHGLEFKHQDAQQWRIL